MASGGAGGSARPWSRASGGASGAGARMGVDDVSGWRGSVGGGERQRRRGPRGEGVERRRGSVGGRSVGHVSATAGRYMWWVN